MQEGVDPASACEQLRALGINVKQTPQASTRLDFEARKLPAEGMVRASVHYYNTEQVNQADSYLPALTPSRVSM